MKAKASEVANHQKQEMNRKEIIKIKSYTNTIP
jgi:hypothetical protein